MDPSQISSLLGDDPLGMFNAPVTGNSTPSIEQAMPQQPVLKQNQPVLQDQIVQSQNTMDPTMGPQTQLNGYEPTLESLNQTVQELQSQKGAQA